MSGTNGDRVESQERGYHLRSGRRIEYRSPVVRRVSETPAHNNGDINEGQEVPVLHEMMRTAPTPTAGI